jgi:hypothetical protein
MLSAIYLDNFAGDTILILFVSISKIIDLDKSLLALKEL